LLVHRLETGEVYSDGGIAAHTPDRICGGVFVVSGAFVDQVQGWRAGAAKALERQFAAFVPQSAAAA